VGEGGHTALFRRDIRPPEGWATEMRLRVVQMVAGPELDATKLGEVEPEPLGPDDVDEMLALVAATEPGPFERRTIELGPYLGVRAGGRLVAMAGERFRCAGYTEVSAVCTDPEYRGRGLASLLTRAVVAGIRARGEEAFLHTLDRNVTAIRVYESLGFTTRTTCEVAVVRRVGAGTRPADAPPELHGG
jgi:ribosomal protein S18 acetylase RimI-like enzyme